MGSSKRLVVAVLILLGSIFAADKNQVIVPKQIVEAKKVFVIAKLGASDSANAQIYSNRVQALVKQWGRFQLAENSQSADIVLVFWSGTYDTGQIVNAGTIVKEKYANMSTLAVYLPTDAANSEPLWKESNTGTWVFSDTLPGLIKKFRKRLEDPKS